MGFKNNFFWGAATSSYQIEGAAFDDGKGKSIWDTFSHEKGKISDESTGDIACDHYNHVDDDVKLMADMGLKAYRFSVSWTRILPNGYGEVCQKGIDFYNHLINKLIEYNITPFMTIYHWDLPYNLHCKGGWLNDDICDLFGEYVKIIAENFSDRVSHFITFNETQIFVGCGYLEGFHAPGYKLQSSELLHMGHNILKSHGKAVKALRKYSKQPVQIGISSASSPVCPLTKSDEDIKTARTAYFHSDATNFVFSDSYWFDPIFLGNYPEKVLTTCKSIMPEITAEDMELISQPIDFVGVNIYRGSTVKADENGNAVHIPKPIGYARTAIGWEITPNALYWGPKFLFERYKKPVYITENGMSAHDCISLDGAVHDPNRKDYMNRYLLEFKRAAEDGVDVAGYFAWSLMDNFEWANGYNDRFGLIYVDFKTQKRILKDSAIWYKSVIENNGDNL